MSEACEIYADLKKLRQDKRASNRAGSAEVLTAAGVAFIAKNQDAHLIVAHAGHTYDFWPGTGLWRMRGSARSNRGVRALLRQLGVPFPNITNFKPDHA